MSENQEYDLDKLINTIIAKDGKLEIRFYFPIPLDDTRKLRAYDLKLIITKKERKRERNQK